jgi:hypothetical protein
LFSKRKNPPSCTWRAVKGFFFCERSTVAGAAVAAAGASDACRQSAEVVAAPISSRFLTRPLLGFHLALRCGLLGSRLLSLGRLLLRSSLLRRLLLLCGTLLGRLLLGGLLDCCLLLRGLGPPLLLGYALPLGGPLGSRLLLCRLLLGCLLLRDTLLRGRLLLRCLLLGSTLLRCLLLRGCLLSRGLPLPLLRGPLFILRGPLSGGLLRGLLLRRLGLAGLLPRDAFLGRQAVPFPLLGSAPLLVSSLLGGLLLSLPGLLLRCLLPCGLLLLTGHTLLGRETIPRLLFRRPPLLRGLLLLGGLLRRLLPRSLFLLAGNALLRRQPIPCLLL